MSMFLLSSFSFASAIDVDTTLKANNSTEFLMVTIVDTHELPTNCKIRAICPNGLEYTDFIWNKTAGYYEGKLPVNDDPSSSIIYNVTVTSHKVQPKYFLVPMTIGYSGFALFHIDKGGGSEGKTVVDFGTTIGYEKIPTFWIFSKPDFHIEIKDSTRTIDDWSSGDSIEFKMSAEIDSYGKIFKAVVIDIGCTVKLNDDDFTSDDNVLETPFANTMTGYPDLSFFLQNTGGVRRGDTIYVQFKLNGQLYWPEAGLTYEVDESSDANNIAVCSFEIQ